MERERWQQIDTIFKSALERAPAERARFLDAACAGDPALREEVESLIAHDEAGSFMEKPASDDAARLLAGGEGASLAGQIIGHYQILEKIGAGGMGEIYQALHTRTHRRVALKLLPAFYTTDEQRVRRFQQEARAVLALNHPNIVTVYDIEQIGQAHFIVTELIEGETLRQRIKHGRLTVHETLDIAIQTASALCAAHQAGVVHRDIKPENVMLRRDGYVKVLDFGLAKLTEKTAAAPPDELEASTRAQIKTDAGMVLGTVSYMSPEQARGKAVDARTDIWSLGVMLYEMAAGRRPFEGETPNHIIVSILEKEPAVLSRHAGEAPAELERIVTKALAKDREERYQTAKDLLIDLRRLKKRLEVEAEIERSAPPEPEDETAATVGAQKNAVATADEPASRTTEGHAAQPTTSAEHLFSEARRHKTGALVVLAILTLAAASSVYFFAGNFGGGKAIDSIAVLPMVNTGADPNTEYLSDGITDSLIHRLSRLPNLKVMSRNSVFRFKGREIDAQAAARALSVRAVLTGRVVQRGNDLSVSVELMDAQDNSHLWGAQYNRKLADIFAVQEEITKEISEKLRLRLSGEEQKLLTKRYTEDTEAYQLFLKCNFYWHKFTPEAERTAVDFCTQAIIKDPNFALPYEGLARSYSVMANNGWARPHDVYPKAKAAVAKGLELEPNSVVMHDALAANLMFYDWDWAAAEREFKRAIEIDPDYWHPHELYGGYLLSAQGRIDEAIAETKRGQEIDPLSLIAHVSAAYPYYFSRQPDRSIEQVRKALELDPGFPIGHQRLGRSFAQQGKYEEAISEYKQAMSLMGRTSQMLGELGQVYAMSGNRAEALKLLDELKAMSANQYVPPLYFAYIYTGLGDKEQALDYLEKSYQERNAWMMWLKVDPRFDSLRSEPRFQDLLRRMNLAP